MLASYTSPNLCTSTVTQLIHKHIQLLLMHPQIFIMETAVAQWLRCCATNRKVAGSIPDGVIGIFH